MGLHVGDRVLFRPYLVEPQVAHVEGVKDLGPPRSAVAPEPRVALVTKVWSESCVNLMVFEDGPFGGEPGPSVGERFTSVTEGGEPGSYALLPRSHYLPPV